ncbi:hypothetical protein CYLTODRAFT_213485 [Cylindrobasidium torrendii FP15055 ss-10]|uniref:Uncharacterized protein n=1 Tax=Cylindrobasidium torrendii FP15055 ss-10 TaxID=1314674 RepID=A0A0D7AUN8_9AGAR|nr:hypothetical protein CYLTODRAFT_213485 [Cylindrobasidium torrendii FP15055 ss-10]
MLVLALLYGQDDDHQALIRLALGLPEESRNWRVLGYIFRQLLKAEVLRVQPDYGDDAGKRGIIERAAYVRPRLNAVWERITEPEREDGEGPIDEAIWRIYAFHRK